MKYNILKRKLVFAIVTLFILSSFIPSFLGEDINKACVKLIFEDGPDIEVGDSGSVDYSFIQDAIDAAEDGDIIWVYSGTYQETLDIIDKDITLIGKPYKKDNPEDPKENPVIDPPPEDDNAVSIVNAEVIFSNFTIKNSLQSGIYIETSCNNTITGNTITGNNDHGISLLVSSDNNMITGNTITDNNDDGIWLGGSSDNTITGNTITDNNDDGIWLGGSSDNTITGNTITDNNDDGIWLGGSSDNTIKDNVFQSNGIVIYGDLLEHWTSHTIENNIANGRPIRYYKNTNNVNVPSDTSQVILANCSNFMIQNLNLSNSDSGIQLGFSSDNTITGNTITDNNDHGIWLSDSSDNTITGNTIDNNREGIWLRHSSDNTITGNTITDNSYNSDGISLEYSSHSNTITGNTIDNNGDGIRLVYSSDNTITGNTITDNNWGGIILRYSSDNMITGNTIDNNDDGIRLSYSSYNNTITGNNITDNSYDGIRLGGYNNIITGNTITDNNWDGISLVLSSDITITGNTIRDNNGDGISLWYSSDNTITGNTITNNSYDGISLEYTSHSNTVTGNTITDNNRDGIRLSDSLIVGGGSSDSNTITGNDIDKNKKGINLTKASYNLITGNNVSNNGHGMVLDINCSANTIFHNNFYQNEHSAKDDGDNVWYSIDYVEGNYWSDYEDKYPGAEDNDGDGIWDDSYLIPGDGINFDKYPFVEPSILLPPFKPSIHCDKHFITVGKSCILTIEAEDPVNQMVRYYVDWGDSEYLDSQTFYDSGEVVTYQHCFDEKGLYEVKVKAINEDGRVSDWSDPWEIAVPKNKMINHPFLRFLEQHPHMFPILRFLLEL